MNFFENIREARRVSLSIFAAASLLALGAAFAPPARAQMDTDDANLVAAIKATFERDPLLAEAIPNIQVNVIQGVATLSGSVHDELSRARAEIVSDSVAGVLETINGLRVESGWIIEDGALENDVIAALMVDPTTHAWEIDVHAEDGVVILGGIVHSWEEAQNAERVARNIRGVAGVKNAIQIEWLTPPDQGPNSDELLESRLHSILIWDARLDARDLNVHVEGGAAKITGSVSGAIDRRLIRQAALATPGIAVVDLSGLQTISAWPEPQWTGEPGLRPAPAGASDEAIRDAIRQRLARDPRVNYFSVDVEVREGEAILRGQVDNLQAKSAASWNAVSTAGVRIVKNYLTLAPPETDDLDANPLDDRVRRALQRDPVVSGLSIGVQAEPDGGIIRLTGSVENSYQSERAEAVASRTRGVLAVANLLSVKADANVFEFSPYADDWRVYRSSFVSQETEPGAPSR
jgi:osmotically-inducible protein OsmY